MDVSGCVSFLGSVRLKQSAMGAMAAGLRELKLKLQGTKCVDVSSYVI
jgi:hypothetical protein